LKPDPKAASFFNDFRFLDAAAETTKAPAGVSRPEAFLIQSFKSFKAGGRLFWYFMSFKAGKLSFLVKIARRISGRVFQEIKSLLQMQLDL